MTAGVTEWLNAGGTASTIVNALNSFSPVKVNQVIGVITQGNMVRFYMYEKSG